MRQIDWQQATAQPYDAVIVGSGFAGCIMAKQLTRAGRRVLIVEAGDGQRQLWPAPGSCANLYAGSGKNA